MTGHITPEMKYVVEQLVPCYGVDGRQRLKPAAFMDMAQEIAYLAAGAMHFGYDELASDGTAWVLSRICFRFLETPSWRDEVSLYTWHKGPYGPFYVRDFSLEGKDGRKLVAATSSWVILDVASRRMMRTTRSSSSASTNILMFIWSRNSLQVKMRMPSTMITSAGSTVTVSVCEREQVR